MTLTRSAGIPRRWARFPCISTKKGASLGGLGHNGGVHIAYAEATRTQAGHDLLQQLEAVRPGKGGVAVREEMSDIPHGAGAQHGVHHGVGEDVGVGVAQQALLIGDAYAAEDQLPVLGQAVYIISVSDPHSSPRPSKIDSASAMSSGVVSFRFS